LGRVPELSPFFVSSSLASEENTINHTPFSLLVLVGLVLIFDFLNGFIGSSSIVATVISSRAMSPRKALAMTAAAEFVGPFLFGVAVAMTLGDELLDLAAMNPAAVLVAISAAILWSLFTWYSGLPSSTSHALVGGLVGAAVAAGGPSALYLTGLQKVAIALFLSPLLGMLFSHLALKTLYFLLRGATPSVNTLFKRLQIVTALVLALSHSANDAQKAMGVIAMSMVVTGYAARFYIPWWSIALCASAIALGTAVGGWRLIKTLGAKFYKIRPVHAFGSQLTSAVVILGAGLLGGPVSSTHVISSAIVGAGSADRISKVRWNAVRDMGLAWLLTIPLSALLAVALYQIVSRFV
jgi:PiT family inorganic phosphate transporter